MQNFLQEGEPHGNFLQGSDLRGARLQIDLLQNKEIFGRDFLEDPVVEDIIKTSREISEHQILILILVMELYQFRIHTNQHAYWTGLI